MTEMPKQRMSNDEIRINEKESSLASAGDFPTERVPLSANCLSA
jgi:hypothetical protein